MTIRWRFYAILGMLALLMLVLAAGGVLAVRSSLTLVNNLYDGALQPSFQLKVVADSYTNAGIVTAIRVRTGDLPWEEGAQLVRRLHRQLKPAWNDFWLAHRDQFDRATVREIEERTTDADAALDELVDILDGQDVAGLATFIARVTYPSIHPLLVSIERLTKRQDEEAQRIFAASFKVIRDQEVELGIVLSIAALAFFGAFSTLRHRVIQPLVGMTRAMTAVASGELDRPVPSTDRRDEIGELALALARFREDARRLQRMTVELAAARDLAEEATRAKSSFLAMMSHEIRTPMNGVTTMAELLEQTELTREQRGLSTVIRQSAAALLAIINDILDVSKIEAGRLDIERVPFSLVELVQGIAALMAERAHERGLTLVVDIDPALPDKMEGDPTRLRQVLLNLLGNAVKFTETGGITLAVERGSRGILFSVTDTGIGLTEEERARLFQPFAQADASTTRRFGGTGLGLSICRKLSTMMGGRIDVRSVAGEGSTFWFELPLLPLDPAPARPDIALTDVRLTVVVSQEAEAASLARPLAAAGIADVLWTSSWPKTIPPEEITGATGPGRLFLVFAHRVAEVPAVQHANPSLKIILAAPRAVIAALAEADRRHLFATLGLPIDRCLLWHVLAAAYGRAALDARPAGGTLPKWRAPEEELARAAGALVLVAEDNPTNQEVIAHLLNRLGYAHQIVANGREALGRLGEGGYGLLLTDFHMPVMNGFQLTGAIRAGEREGGRRLPILALTADAQPETETRCRDAGMDGFLAKPIDTQALMRSLDHWLPHAAGLRRPPEPSAPNPAPAPEPAAAIDPEILDQDRLRESFGSFGEEARAFLATFLDGMPAMLEALDQALARDASTEARDIAHALKGAAASVGAVRLHQLAADVQACLDGGDVDTARLMASLLPPTLDELLAALRMSQ